MVPKIETLFLKLEETTHKSFFGKPFGEEVIIHLHSSVSIAIRKGGIAIPKQEEITDLNY